MKNLIAFFLFCIFVFSNTLFAQDEPIFLKNASFEGTASYGIADKAFNLDGWYACNMPGQTPPDIHPVENGSFLVVMPPHDGKTYVGLVVRQNETWESVSQKLETPMLAGICYDFSLSLCRSETYYSGIPGVESETRIHYNTPAKLRIWGGSGVCNKAELLAESAVVTNSKRWLQHNFHFEPKQQHTYIVLEAYYNEPIAFFNNGNILLDNASPLIPVPCTVVRPEAPEEKKDTIKAVVEKPKILEQLDRKTLKTGQTIRIDQLYFKADSSSFTNDSYPVLNEIYTFLASNPDVVVEIGGHTNGIPPDDYCDRLSTARAKAVAEHLVSKGIPKDRLQYKGYGKRQPVATNKSDYGRKQNQRVEIKILSFNG